MKLLIAAFLAGHALIHASYLTPAPAQTAGGPEWPFTMSRSWLVTGLHHPWIVLGLVIDAALLWSVLVAGWAPAVGS